MPSVKARGPSGIDAGAWIRLRGDDGLIEPNYSTAAM
jgi:hypothetical protein